MMKREGRETRADLRCVEHVGHSDPLQIVDVADGVAIAQNDSVVNFVTVNSKMSPLVVVTGRLEAWQRSVFSGPGVDYRVYQFISCRLPRYGGRPESQISAIISTKFLEVTGDIFSIPYKHEMKIALTSPVRPGVACWNHSKKMFLFLQVDISSEQF